MAGFRIAAVVARDVNIVSMAFRVYSLLFSLFCFWMVLSRFFSLRVGSR